jgi:DNA-binding GntR family transcriptional regulator
VVAEHQGILDALRDRDAEAADRLISLHMDASAARLSVPKADAEGEVPAR